MPLIKALRQLCGDYGNIPPGGEFFTDPTTANQLVANGLAEMRTMKKVVYQAKVVTPESSTPTVEAPEVSARPQPFRDSPVHHAESSPVATAGDPVLSEPDVPKPGTPDSGVRRGRGRSST